MMTRSTRLTMNSVGNTWDNQGLTKHDEKNMERAETPKTHASASAYRDKQLANE